MIFMSWEEDVWCWYLEFENGEMYMVCFVIIGIGVLFVLIMLYIEGMDDF